MPASLSRRTEAVLSRTEGRVPGSTVSTRAARRGRNSATRTIPSALPDDAQARIEVRPLHREGNHLDGGRETARVHHRLVGKSRQGELLDDRVHRRDPLLVHAEHPAHRREKIATPGERGAGDQPGAGGGAVPRPRGRPRQRLRELPGRVVLGDVVRVQARRHHRVVSGTAERRDVVGRQPLPLLEHPPGKPEPVGEDRGLRVGERGRTEAHGVPGATASARPPAPGASP